MWIHCQDREEHQLKKIFVETLTFKKSLADIKDMLEEKYEDFGQDGDMDMADVFDKEKNTVLAILDKISQYRFQTFFCLLELIELVKEDVPEFTLEFYMNQIRNLKSVNEIKVRKLQSEIDSIINQNNQYTDIETKINNEISI